MDAEQRKDQGGREEMGELADAELEQAGGGLNFGPNFDKSTFRQYQTGGSSGDLIPVDQLSLT